MNSIRATTTTTLPLLLQHEGAGSGLLEPKPRERPLASTSLLVVMGLVIAGLLASWAHRQKVVRAGLAGVAEPERRELFERTRSTVERSCARPPNALRDYCDREAEFLLLFPECDLDCERLAKARLSSVASPQR